MADVRFPFELRNVWQGTPHVQLNVQHVNRPISAEELRAIADVVEAIEAMRDVVNGTVTVS